MREVDLETLRNDVVDRLQLGELSSNSAPTIEAVDRMINQSLQAFTAMLMEAYGDDYYTTKTTLSVTAESSEVTLPTDFYKLKRVLWVKQAGAEPVLVPLRRMSVDSIADNEAVRDWANAAPGFAVMGADSLKLFPKPKIAVELVLWYVHLVADLEHDEDTFAVPGPGWEEWIVLDVCCRISQREKRADDVQRFMGFRSDVERRIRAQAPARAETQARQIRDVRGDGAYWPRRCDIGGGQ